MQRDGLGKLQIVQNFGYKFSEIINIEFGTSSEDLNRQNITFRYNQLKARFAFVSQRLSDVIAFVKLKNPTLLNSLMKPNQSFMGSSLSGGKQAPGKSGLPFK